jgi:hypothetical protein
MTLEATAQEMCSVGHEHDEEEEMLLSLREAAQIPVFWQAPQESLQQVRAQQKDRHRLALLSSTDRIFKISCVASMMKSMSWFPGMPTHSPMR